MLTIQIANYPDRHWTSFDEGDRSRSRHGNLAFGVLSHRHMKSTIRARCGGPRLTVDRTDDLVGAVDDPLALVQQQSLGCQQVSGPGRNHDGLQQDQKRKYHNSKVSLPAKS